MLEPATLLDRRFLELDPSAVDVPEAIRHGRAAVREMCRLVGPMSDEDLARPWSWTGEGREDVRTAAYLALAALHDGTGAAADAVRNAGLAPGPAGGALAAVARARWELHGVLEPLDEDLFGADPGGGEWSIRQTVGHIVESQRAYPWFSAWWLERRDGPLPDRADDAHGEGLPNEEADASGSIRVVSGRLDALVDLAVSLWSAADDQTLAVPARWAGFPVTLGFRTLRWSAHLEEHTLQVEKTLAMLGAATPEGHRLGRLLCRAWGHLEAVILALPAPMTETAASDEVAGDAIRVAVEGALALVRDGAAAAR
jgi:hypothetical protein